MDLGPLEGYVIFFRFNGEGHYSMKIVGAIFDKSPC
jgi:hypothetical protein